MLEITVYLVPEPWKNPLYSGKSKHFYRVKSTTQFQAALREAWRLKYGGRAPIRGVAGRRGVSAGRAAVAGGSPCADQVFGARL